jgi:hypothetical protein
MGGAGKGNNGDDELMETMKKEKNPNWWEKNLHKGGKQTPFRRGGALMEDKRSLQEGKWQPSTIEEERAKNPNF